MTHAFFKALLFLGAGSVIHGLEGEQDIRKMGGLRSRMPKTYLTFLIATIAIAGIFPFAGFFSKDEILWGAFSSGHRGVWAALLVGAGITAFYMFRLLYLVFFGKERGHAHAHESPASMTVPLQILAVLSLVGGFVGLPLIPGWNLLGAWLEPSIVTAGHGHGEGGGEHHGSVGLEIGLMLVALAVAVLGILLARSIYRDREGIAERWARRFGPLYTMVRNYYWVDELYELVVLRPFYAACRLSRAFDVHVVDGLVNGTRHVTVGASHESHANDRWIVDGLVNLAGGVVSGASAALRRLQTGVVQSYAAAMVLGIFLLLVLYSLAR
jgi:NADH-quinone oxidoreductase subunit L